MRGAESRRLRCRPPPVPDSGSERARQEHVERRRDPRLRLELRSDGLAQHLRRQGFGAGDSRGGRRGGEPAELVEFSFLEQLVDGGIPVRQDSGAVSEPVEDDAKVLGVAVDEEAALIERLVSFFLVEVERQRLRSI